jgi:hypothetical protein
MKDRTNEILKYVSSLSGWERKFAGDLIAISGEFQKYMHETGSNMDQFCADFEVSPRDAEKLLNGGISYSIKHLATLEYLWTKHRRLKQEKQ